MLQLINKGESDTGNQSSICFTEGNHGNQITKVGNESSLSDIDKGDFTNIDGEEELKLWNLQFISRQVVISINAIEWVSSGFKHI